MKPAFLTTITAPLLIMSCAYRDGAATNAARAVRSARRRLGFFPPKRVAICASWGSIAGNFPFLKCRPPRSGKLGRDPGKESLDGCRQTKLATRYPEAAGAFRDLASRAFSRRLAI